jgi:hypothetical protein
MVSQLARLAVDPPQRPGQVELSFYYKRVGSCTSPTPTISTENKDSTVTAERASESPPARIRHCG